MHALEATDLPAKLAKIVAAATERGWTTSATGAEVDGVATIAIRFRQPGFRCYGVWEITTTKTGKPSLKWRQGGRASWRLAPLDTLAALHAHLGTDR